MPMPTRLFKQRTTIDAVANKCKIGDAFLKLRGKKKVQTAEVVAPLPAGQERC